jgi:hypothetical protein
MIMLYTRGYAENLRSDSEAFPVRPPAGAPNKSQTTYKIITSSPGEKFAFVLLGVEAGCRVHAMRLSLVPRGYAIDALVLENTRLYLKRHPALLS